MTDRDDRSGATIDRSRTGEVTLTLDGVRVTSPVRAGAWTAIDEQRALFVLLDRVSSTESEQVRVEWKAAAYEQHCTEEPKNQRYAEKREYWVAERDRLHETAVRP